MVHDSDHQGIFTQEAAGPVPSEWTEEIMWAVLHLAELHVPPVLPVCVETCICVLSM